MAFAASTSRPVRGRGLYRVHVVRTGGSARGEDH